MKDCLFLQASLFLIGTRFQQASSQTTCFSNGTELREAVQLYEKEPSPDSFVSQTYGYPIGDWCVDQVEIFDYVFAGSALNEPLTNWNTSSATSMSYMFQGAQNFNQPLDSFDTSKVTSFLGLFSGASAFNGTLAWNTSNVQVMSGCFNDASSFNRPLEWDTSKVTDMQSLFHNASSFNQFLAWDLSRAENTFYMFAFSTFNQPVDHFDTARVRSMAFMFKQATEFNHPISFDISSLFSTEGMFNGAKRFNQDLCEWGERLVDNEVNVKASMFGGTSCPNINGGTIDLDAQPPGPFCHTCGVMSSTQTIAMSTFRLLLALTIASFTFL